MVGPNYRPPQAAVPDRWAGPVPEPAAALPDVDLARWWTVFDDALLSSLEERAVRSNLDLKQAEARIRQARAARASAASGLGPMLDATGSFQRSRSPGRSSNWQDGNTRGLVSNNYDAGFDAGWELDIFGGIRRNLEAADADLLASVESRRDVLVTLTAEVARNYIELRSFQQRIDIARRNLAIQEHSARLTRQRFEGGFVSGLDVANANAQVATTASQIPLLEAAARQSIYALGILLGQEPAALVPELAPTSAIPAAPPAATAGVPSDLLRRRPDIRRAEAEIHAATARIGVATADLFPRFTITGSAGLSSGDFSSWLTWAQRFWALGPSASWRLFDTGRTQSNIAQQETLQEQALIAFRQTVLTALQEVENALIASTKEQERRQLLVSAVDANRKAVSLAKTLYTEGQTDFLSVLDAQRSLFLSEETLALSTDAVSTDLVALHKALGGGWSDTSGDGRGSNPN
ncbi:MAG: efflux transporter outer membrane subunit [Deltaproteobacteria bacterium]|nr:efflux transporter outer membrane subunit [Deltaproteobacteria bacterium]